MGTYFFLVILIVTLLFVLRRYFLYRALDYKKLIRYNPITTENTIIAFDLHDVLVRYDYKEIFHLLYKNPKKFTLLISLLNPLLWFDLIKLFTNNAVAEQYIVILGNKYKKLQPHIPMGVEIANSQLPVPQMVDLLKYLKKLGYELHLFSNIGAEIFEALKLKLPNLFHYFDSLSIPSQKNGYLRKPYQNAFDNFLSQHDTMKKQVIFIDDKKKNIKKAQENKIIGIHFRSPCQIKRELEEIGVI